MKGRSAMKMNTTSFRLLAALPLALVSGTAAVAQTEPATQFFNFICEIDVSVLGTGFTVADGTTSVFTFDSRRLCTGAASARNAKIECDGNIPGWNQGQRSASGFACTINGDTCGLAPPPPPAPGSENAPFLTTTDSNLTVTPAGAANLTCFFKP
jgi:hypothetical protein